MSNDQLIESYARALLEAARRITEGGAHVVELLVTAIAILKAAVVEAPGLNEGQRAVLRTAFKMAYIRACKGINE